MDQFRELPADALFAAWQGMKKTRRMGGCTPVLDGRFIVGGGTELLAQGKQKKIPYLCGTISHDVVPPILFQMAKKWCSAQERRGYAWFFDRRLPGGNSGAWHSSDLWYWFGTLKNCWRPMTEKDQILSDEMTGYLTNFCKFGDPNGGDRTVWLPMTKGQNKVLRLGEGNTRMGTVNMAKLGCTMLTNKAVGE